MFQVRLRVYVREGMTKDQPMLRLSLAGREVEITSGSDHAPPLTGKNWIRFRTGGITTREEAIDFGRKLQSWVRIASICCLWGIDLGGELHSPTLDEIRFKSAKIGGPDDFLLQEGHGLLVIEDDPRIRFFSITGNLTVSRPPQEFLSALGDLSNSDAVLSDETLNSLRLINQALVNREPLAQIVLAVSAVETIGQTKKWSENQRNIIEHLSNSVRNNEDIPEEERLEVAEMLDRSHRISLRQGVKRALIELGLIELMSEWDRIYGLRSKIFHDPRNSAGIQIHAVAYDAVRLCGQIVLSMAAQDGLLIPVTAFDHFPVLRKKADEPGSRHG